MNLRRMATRVGPAFLLMVLAISIAVAVTEADGFGARNEGGNGRFGGGQFNGGGDRWGGMGGGGGGPAPTYGIGFYRRSCPDVELIVGRVVLGMWARDRSVTAGLLRMVFHDCFPSNGCDASVLIKSTPSNKAERDNFANSRLHGFDVIDAAKAAVESACPGVVSCADIMHLATRDSVLLAGGVFYEVPTGRRDGRVSLDATANELPGPSVSVTDNLASFAARGLNANDLVTLLGAHTTGVTHCDFISERLWDFQGTGTADPSMDPALVAILKLTCPKNTPSAGSRPLSLDLISPLKFDNSYFTDLLQNRGMLRIDQALTLDPTTLPLVTAYAQQRQMFGSGFGFSFGRSMVKLGNLKVLTGTQGEIRRTCGAVN